MKKPTKKQINYLRVAVGMSGMVAINNAAAELILITQSEMERLGGDYSLKDAAKVSSFIQSKYKVRK